MGKLLPYALVGFIELLIVLLVMVYVFGVPIHGSISLLMGQNVSILSQVLATNGSGLTEPSGSSQLVRGPTSLVSNAIEAEVKQLDKQIKPSILVGKAAG